MFRAVDLRLPPNLNFIPCLVRSAVKRTYAPALAFTILFVLTWALPAHAELGPCKPLEKREVLICGEGKGAAIVIPDTVSPSGRLALAWRNPDAPPTEQPDDNQDLELLVVRLADGAALSRGKTDFWDTGEMRANRLQELATWSPDSRLLVRTFNGRFATGNVDLYAFGADDKAAAPIDFLKIVDPLVRARLRSRVKNADDYDFFLTGMKDPDKPVTIDNRGQIVANVMLWVPKLGPFYYYTVKAQATRSKDTLDVRILSIVYRGMEPREE